MDINFFEEDHFKYKYLLRGLNGAKFMEFQPNGERHGKMKLGMGVSPKRPCS